MPKYIREVFNDVDLFGDKYYVLKLYNNNVIVIHRDSGIVFDDQNSYERYIYLIQKKSNNEQIETLLERYNCFLLDPAMIKDFTISIKTTILKNGDFKDLVYLQNEQVISIGQNGLSLFDSQEHHDKYTTDINCKRDPIWIKFDTKVAA
jgi:hypothetical protein